MNLPEYPNPKSRKKTPLHDFVLAGLAIGNREMFIKILSECDPPILKASSFISCLSRLEVPLKGRQSADAMLSVKYFRQNKTVGNKDRYIFYHHKTWREKIWESKEEMYSSPLQKYIDNESEWPEF